MKLKINNNPFLINKFHGFFKPYFKTYKKLSI